VYAETLLTKVGKGRKVKGRPLVSMRKELNSLRQCCEKFHCLKRGEGKVVGTRKVNQRTKDRQLMSKPLPPPPIFDNQ